MIFPWTRRLLPLIVLTASAAPAATGTTEEVSWQLKAELEKPLKERVSQILERRNEQGIQNTRGSYLDRFEKVDEGYAVTFDTSTAFPEELRISRHRLTLVPEGKGWRVGAEELEKEISGYFFRSTPADETFHAFDAFSFAAEGLRVQGGSGSAYIDYRCGKPLQITLRADNLVYEYAPPADTHYAALYPILAKRAAAELVFSPSDVTIFCGAANCEAMIADMFTGLRDVTRSEIHAKLDESYREFREEQEKSRRENPLSGFGPMERPGNRWWSVSIFRDNDHRIRVTYDDEDPSEVAYYVSGKGTVYRYHSEQTRRSGASRAALERRPVPGRLDYEVVGLKGEIDLALEDASSMRADLTFKLKLLRPGNLVSFDIDSVGSFRDEKKDSKDPSLDIEIVEDGAGQELVFVKQGETSGYILLPEERATGEELTIRVVYTNANAIYKLNAFYSYVSRSGWLPFVKFGDLIDEYDVTFAVPRRYQILGVGRMAASETGAQETTARFTSDRPVHFPTVIFGKYATDSSKVEVKTADGTAVPVNVYVDDFSMSGQGFDIRINQLRPIADQAANALNLYQEILGVDYPHGKLDIVNAVFQNPFGGQSPASIVYLGGAVFRGTGAVANAMIDAGGMTKFMESVVAHEVGHQWWGGSIAQANWRNYWFVESLAEYMAALYLENVHAAGDPAQGWAKYLDKVQSWRRSILTTDIVGSVKDSDTLWLGESYGRARRALIYDYGPYAFHMLRMTFRDYRGGAGDEKFFLFLKALAQEFQGQEIVTSDIQRVAESALGGVGPDGTPYTVDLDWFFDQWVRGVGMPELRLKHESRLAEDGNWIVQGSIAQRVVVGKDRDLLPGKTFRGLVLLTVTADKQEFPVPVVLDGAETSFGFKVPAKPTRVTLNRDGEMLAYDVPGQ